MQCKYCHWTNRSVEMSLQAFGYDRDIRANWVDLRRDHRQAFEDNSGSVSVTRVDSTIDNADEKIIVAQNQRCRAAIERDLEMIETANYPSRNTDEVAIFWIARD